MCLFVLCRLAEDVLLLSEVVADVVDRAVIFCTSIHKYECCFNEFSFPISPLVEWKKVNLKAEKRVRVP